MDICCRCYVSFVDGYGCPDTYMSSRHPLIMVVTVQPLEKSILYDLWVGIAFFKSVPTQVQCSFGSETYVARILFTCSENSFPSHLISRSNSKPLVALRKEDRHDLKLSGQSSNLFSPVVTSHLRAMYFTKSIMAGFGVAALICHSFVGVLGDSLVCVGCCCL